MFWSSSICLRISAVVTFAIPAGSSGLIPLYARNKGVSTGVAQLISLRYDAPMTKKQAIKVFGSRAAIARKCGISRQAVSKWPEAIPFYWAYYLAAISDGKLKAGKGPQ